MSPFPLKFRFDTRHKTAIRQRIPQGMSKKFRHISVKKNGLTEKLSY